MELWSKLIEIIKIPLKILLPSVWVFSTILLFSSDSFIEKINLVEFREKNGFYFGLIFLISTSLIIIYLIHFLYQKIYKLISAHNANKKNLKIIFNLNEVEQGCILKLYNSEIYTECLSYTEPIVKGLIARRFIYIGNNAQLEMDYNGDYGVKCTLQPHVYNALRWGEEEISKKMKKLLKRKSQKKNTIKLDKKIDTLQHYQKIIKMED